MSTSPYRAPADNDTVERIVAAARRRFREKTVAKTWMANVADDVGLARQSLYSFVAGRRGLVELALVARCSELAPRFMLQPGAVVADVRDAFVEMTATMVECTRGDEEFLALAAALPREHLFAVLAGPSRVREMVIESLTPLLDAADDRRELRGGLSRPDMCAWVQSVVTSLAGRPDLDPSSLREVLRNYLLPAILVT